MRVVDLAYGVSSYYTIFGMNGHKKDAMIMDAKRNMYEAFPLQSGQAYANFAVDIKTTVYIIGREVKVIVSADIVEKGVTKNKDFSTISNKLRKLNGSGLLKAGDKILFSRPNYPTQEATVQNVKINRTVKISVFNNDGSFKLRNIEYIDAVKYRGLYLQKHNKSYGAKKNEKEETFVEKPFELNVPEDAKGKIVTFKYKGKTWQGELLKEMYNGYMIRVTNQYGTTKSYVIPKEDVIIPE